MPSLTNQPAAIDIAHVDVRRGDLHILQDISAAVPQGSSTVLVGPNGAGKSTLLHCIINEIAYTGEIRMQGKSGRRPRLAYVPQNLQMDSALPLTVAEFLSLGHQRRPLWLGIKGSASRRARAALAPVHAEHLIRRRMSDLSGGELRRVLLAAALAREPEILLLDEPLGGVDPVTRREILRELESEAGRPAAPADPDEQVSLSDMAEAGVAAVIRRTQVDALSPLEALNLLYELKSKLS